MRTKTGAWARTASTAGLIWIAASLSAPHDTAARDGTSDSHVGAGAGGWSELALSIPRPPQPGGVGGIPQVLLPSDAALYRRIFALQDRGRITEAAAETERLADTLLLGHILADRLLGPHTRATVPELTDWLSRFADQPDAGRIHALLLARLPRGAKRPDAPEQPTLPVADLFDDEDRLILPPGARNPGLVRTVRERLRTEEFAAAEGAIAGARGVDPAQAGLLRAEIARAFFLRNRDTEALAAAAAGIRRDGAEVADLHWIAGLAAWRLGRFDVARRHFEATARADIGTSARRAAGAFWAARAALRTRDPRAYTPWLQEAAKDQRSFYGLLARRSLGLPGGFAWERDTLGEAEAALLAAHPGGLRALALLQVGERARAEGELRAMGEEAAANPALARAMLVVASQAGMPDTAMRLAGLAESGDGRPRDYARFPLPRWAPSGGFRTDPALLLALARMESNFEPGAVSPAGARGIMQIMPVTAGYVTGQRSLAGRDRHRLHEPEFNLEVGQRYIEYLARHPGVDGDLIHLIGAYNSGPGNLAKWAPAVQHKGDPLLFLEAIPIHETRRHVQTVLTYSWVYASRLGRPAPSLDALAAGRWPRYIDADGGTIPGAEARQR
jgi:soluble lytic murein transglycosylase-like protein